MNLCGGRGCESRGSKIGVFLCMEGRAVLGRLETAWVYKRRVGDSEEEEAASYEHISIRREPSYL
jgi:hypothetical protein